ncbi:recombinase family protein [Micromonospora sp. NPDC049891]|uniref:recombinase family protein n=1 Tax=Micromonospora sp. NPDC049891 TaxID=3155655 RepID=UPI0033D88C7C
MAAFEDYLYARISEDELGLEKGVTRQLRECREYSEKTGGRAVAEFSDNDISALKAAPRPDFDRLMAALAAPNPTGIQRRIVAVHTSRVWRNRVERAHGIELGGRLGIIVKPVNGVELDLRTAQGRMLAEMLGAQDTGESETKAERIQSAARERAEEGRANAYALYGWQRVYEYDSRGKVTGFRDEEHPEHASIVREIVDRLLSGDTLKGITADLNARGVPAPRAGDRRKHRAKGQTEDGSLWGKTSVRKLADRPANIGLRIYHRGRPDEQWMPAAWPKIVDPDKHDLVAALLADPARGRRKPSARTHLLSWGVGESPCGSHLRVAPRGSSKWGTKQPTYVCDKDGCVGRNKEAVDRRVNAVMEALLRRPDVLALLEGSTHKQAEALKRVEALKARMMAAAAQYADEVITDGQLRVITGRLKPQLQAAEAEAASYRPSPHVSLVLDTVAEPSRWQGYSINQKRAIMEAFGVRVIIDKTRRGPGFDPTSVRIIPRPSGDG